MPAPPNLLERAVFAANAAPAVVLDVAGAAGLRAVHAALRLGLFEALRGGPLPAEALAARVGAEARALGILLRALEGLGYARERGGAWALTPQAERWLLRDGPRSVAGLVEFWQRVVFPFWDAHLDEVLRKGAPSRTLYQWLDDQPGGWELAQGWFRAGARLAAPEVAARLALPQGSTRVLDLGGGHGLYSVELCRANPGLRATVLDLPRPLEQAKATLAAEPRALAARVALQPGDYHGAELGEGWDAVLLFNVLHGERAEANAALLRRAAQALRPGGVVAVVEQLEGRAPGPAVEGFVRLLGLTYLAALGGQVYRLEDVAAWMASAGLGRPTRLRLRSAPGTSLLVAAKP